MSCCGSAPMCPAKHPGRRIKKLSVRQQNEAAMRVALGEAGDVFVYTNARGRCRWLGLWWAGVPYPIRLWLWAGRYLSSPSKLDGCGCVVPLKAAWLRLRRRFGL